MKRKYYISEKSLVSEYIFKKLLQVNNKKTKTQLNGQKIRRHFLQRRGINGKQVCKKLLNISLYDSLVVVVLVTNSCPTLATHGL